MCLTGTYYIRFNSIESGFPITLAHAGEDRHLSRVDIIGETVLFMIRTGLKGRYLVGRARGSPKFYFVTHGNIGPSLNHLVAKADNRMS